MHTTVDGFAGARVGRGRERVARALGVSFARYALADGTSGYVASAAPLVGSGPRSRLGDHQITGPLRRRAVRQSPRPAPERLRDQPAAHERVRRAPARRRLRLACTSARDFASTDFWTPDQVENIYGVHDLLAQDMGGQAKTIGILELAPSRPSDTNHYLSCMKLHTQVVVRKIDGGASPDQLGTLEAEIDIQEAATEPPGAVHPLVRSAERRTGRVRRLPLDDHRQRSGHLYELGSLRGPR